MKNQTAKAPVQKIEVRSSINDNLVVSFEHSQDESVNLVTAGYNKICSMFKIDRMNAENRYYVTKA